MNTTLTSLRAQLEAIIAQLQLAIPSDQAIALAQANWSFPGLTRSELVEEAQALIDVIDLKQIDNLGEHDAQLLDYVPRLQFLAQNTVANIWTNASQAVPAYLFTLKGLRKQLNEVLGDDYANATKRVRNLTSQLRTMEARLAALEPRTATMGAMVDRIEQAYSAAENLPTDLEELAEARQKVAKLTEEAYQDQTRLLDMRKNAELTDKLLQDRAQEAQAVLERTERAYSGATSLALASAFSTRATKLESSMWIWVIGLLLSLAAGGLFGSSAVHELVLILAKPYASPVQVTANVLLTIMSVGAPVWFAWLSTKQIGHRFRLSEDYAFKASISQAYDGFRREAIRVDKALERKLLESALSRFDEQPLRLVETATHGSPWQEMAGSEVVKKALGVVPEAVEAVSDVAKYALSRLPNGVKSDRLD